jgi:hypothetical protein
VDATQPTQLAIGVLLQRGGSRSGGRGNSILVFVPGVLLVLGVFALTQHMASFRSRGHRVSYAYHHDPAASVAQVNVRFVLDCTLHSLIGLQLASHQDPQNPKGQGGAMPRRDQRACQ